MIYEQLLWALGYKGGVIALSEDYRSNRHIAVSSTQTLCGKPMKLSQLVYGKDGKFIGYRADSFDKVYGFYGSQRCKECLMRYLRHRLSPKGKKLVRLYHARIALRLPQRSR